MSEFLSKISSSFSTKFLRLHEQYWVFICVLSFVLAGGGVYFAKGLGLDTNLESLLPKESANVKNLRAISQKSGGSYDFRILIEGVPYEKLIEAAKAFEEFARSRKQFFRSVQFRTPKTFLEANKLKLIPLEALNTIASKVEAERKNHPEVADPLGLEDEPSTPSVSPGATGAAATTTPEDEDQLKLAKDWLRRLDEMRPYYETKDQSYLAIRVVPEAESIDLEKNRQLLAEMKRQLKEFDFSRIDPAIRYSVIGTIPDHIDRYDSILRDVSVGGFGVIVILIIIVLYFASLWALPTLVPPLLTGLAMGLGVVALTEKTLNLIAVFLVVVVFGVGIEFGIHLWARFLQERRGGRDVHGSLEETWNSTGRATLTSAFALLTGFALLTLSTFQGFAQFGRVAIILLTAVAGSFLIFMPSWILFTERLRSKKFRGPRVDAWVSAADKLAHALPDSTVKGIRYLSFAVVGASIVLCLTKLSFDYRFEEDVKAETVRHEHRVEGQIFTERLKPSAIGVFSDEASAANFLEYFRKNKSRFPDIALMSGLPSFLPVDQEARIKRLQEISDLFEKSWLKKMEDEQIGRVLNEIKDKAYILAPHRMEDLPVELKDPFLSSGKALEYLVFIFDIGGKTDGRKSMKFSDALELFTEESGMTPLIGGQEIVFADIVRRVIHEGPLLVAGMFLLIFLICWLDFRSLRKSTVTMLPVLAGFAMTGALMVITDNQINFFNMVALASLGSMVVDNSIHLFHRYLEARDSGDQNPTRTASVAVGPSVLACTCTSISGYGGMWLANHTGVSSLGSVAVSGLICCFVASVIFFPTWLARRQS